MSFDFEAECTRLRKLLRLRQRTAKPSNDKDAGVLILLQRFDTEYRILLCVRSESLRRHPGEVCFPGGMRDDGENLFETAMREAREEVGLVADDYVILGGLPSFRSRFGVMIHPTVALVRRPLELELNLAEVTRVFWKPIEDFLDDQLHTSYNFDSRYSIHSFYFAEAHTYGVTALMSIVIAMGILQKQPKYDLTPQVTLDLMSRLSVNDTIDTIFFAAIQTPRMNSSKL